MNPPQVTSCGVKRSTFSYLADIKTLNVARANHKHTFRIQTSDYLYICCCVWTAFGSKSCSKQPSFMWEHALYKITYLLLFCVFKHQQLPKNLNNAFKWRTAQITASKWPNKWGWQQVCRSKSEAFKVKKIVPSVKHGGGSIILWACFAARGNGTLLKVNGIMKEQDYLQILQPQLDLKIAGWLKLGDN